MTHAVPEIASAAQTEAARMSAAIDGKQGDDRVTMSVAQFAKLAGLIGTMSDMLVRPDPGSFGEARYWVPLDVFKQARDRAQSLESECAALRTVSLNQQLSLSALR